MRIQISHDIQCTRARTRSVTEPDRPVDFPAKKLRPALAVQEDVR